MSLTLSIATGSPHQVGDAALLHHFFAMLLGPCKQLLTETRTQQNKSICIFFLMHLSINISVAYSAVVLIDVAMYLLMVFLVLCVYLSTWLFLNVFVYLSVYWPTAVFVQWSIYLGVYLLVYPCPLSIRVSIVCFCTYRVLYLSMCLFFLSSYLPICLSVSLSLCLSVLSVCLSVYQSIWICLSVHLSDYLSIWRTY